MFFIKRESLQHHLPDKKCSLHEKLWSTLSDDWIKIFVWQAWPPLCCCLWQVWTERRDAASLWCCSYIPCGLHQNTDQAAGEFGVSFWHSDWWMLETVNLYVSMELFITLSLLSLCSLTELNVTIKCCFPWSCSVSYVWAFPLLKPITLTCAFLCRMPACQLCRQSGFVCLATSFPAVTRLKIISRPSTKSPIACWSMLST